MDRIMAHQLGQLLEIPSRYELDGFLKHHGVPLEYTIEDFEREGATSARLWQKRKAEQSADGNRDRQLERLASPKQALARPAPVQESHTAAHARWRGARNADPNRP